MTNSAFQRFTRPMRLTHRLALVFALTSFCLPFSVSAQAPKGKKTPPGSEKVAGKITSLEHKGKSLLLTIEKEEGGTLEVQTTPRIKLGVVAKGDASVLLPKVMVASDSLVVANGELFGKKFDVYLGESPPPRLERDANSDKVVHICGQFVATEGASMLLNCAGKATKVNFEEGAPLEITVHSPDPDLVEEDAQAEVEGLQRGAKFVVSAVTVTLDKTLTADDLTKDDDRKKGRAKTAGVKKNAKGKPTDTGDLPSNTDPFGVLDSKDKPAPGKKK